MDDDAWDKARSLARYGNPLRKMHDSSDRKTATEIRRGKPFGESELADIMPSDVPMGERLIAALNRLRALDDQ